MHIIEIKRIQRREEKKRGEEDEEGRGGGEDQESKSYLVSKYITLEIQ